MKNRLIVLSLISLSSLLTSNLLAQENSKIEVLSTEAQTNTKDGNLVISVFGIASAANEQVKNNFNGGLGGFIEFQYDEHLGFETGAFYMSNQYVYSDKEIRRVSDVNRIHIPVLVKVWPTNFLNFGIGPYASFRVSDEKKLIQRNTYESIENGSKSVEYGIDLASSFTFTINDKTGLFAGLRYSLPLEQKVRSRLENNTSILAGLNFQI